MPKLNYNSSFKFEVTQVGNSSQLPDANASQGWSKMQIRYNRLESDVNKCWKGLLLIIHPNLFRVCTLINYSGRPLCCSFLFARTYTYITYELSKNKNLCERAKHLLINKTSPSLQRAIKAAPFLSHPSPTRFSPFRRLKTRYYPRRPLLIRTPAYVSTIKRNGDYGAD